MEKSFILFFLAFVFLLNVQAQSFQKILNNNEVKLTVNPSGVLFNSQMNNAPQYEVPADSGNHLLYFSNFWFMGKTNDDKLKSSINLDNYISETAHFRGPYSSTNSYNEPDYLSKYAKNQWQCSQEEVAFHIDNFQHPNYQMPESIATWPGNGDTTLGVSYQLAPFVDLNDNGIYEPELGEYPCFKGDEAVYTILNDNTRNHDLTGERGMGLELHLMVYQLNNGDYIDSTTFVDVTVYNRGSADYPEFRSAFFIDGDVGFAFDDYLGSHEETNTLYFYNSTNNDNHYGENPPAVGITTLNHEAYAINVFTYSGMFLPMLTPINFWHCINGLHRDGFPIHVGGSGVHDHPDASNITTNFIYHGEPWSGNGWSEVNIDGNGKRNPPDEDKRGYIATNPISLMAGEKFTYAYAVVTSRKGDYLENTKGVVDLAQKVKEFYNETILGDCRREATGIQADIIKIDEIDPFLYFEITRLDGEGNMFQDLELTEETVSTILQDGFAEQPTYQRAKGPISIEIADTGNHATGYFMLWFNDFSEQLENTTWTIYQYDYKGGNLIDSVHSEETISFDGVQYIEKWEFFVQITDYKPDCLSNNGFCTSHILSPAVVNAEMISDEETPWLTGVKNVHGWMPQNWITSSITPYNGEQDYLIDENNSLTNVACYNADLFLNRDFRYSNLLGGIIAPSIAVRTNNCGFMPIQPSTSLLPSIMSYENIRRNNHGLAFHPSIDLVFTSDKSKWTRCPVIELTKYEEMALQDEEFGDPPISGLLRQSKSIDKSGRQLGDADYNEQEANLNGNQPVGMGWFPGYAIDVETGRRLNMAYGENSTLLTENGGDMQWNPTENMYNATGAPLFGGQHAIYVFGGQFDEMPNYDEGNFLHEKLSERTIAGFQHVYRNLSWVMQPMLAQGQELLASDVRIRMRIGKQYNVYPLTYWNEGQPLFEWNAVPYSSLFPEPDETFLLVYPNPATGPITVKWEDPEIKELQIYDSKGALVKNITLEQEQLEVSLNVEAYKSGVYFLRAHNLVKKIIISK